MIYTVALVLSIEADNEEDALEEFERRVDNQEWDSGSVDVEIESPGDEDLEDR